MQNPSLLELLFKIINNTLKHFKLVSAIVLVPTIIVFVLVMWVIDPVYSSRAVVSPPNSNNSLGKLSGLMGAGMGSMSSILGLSMSDNDADAVWTILHSWEIHNQIIEEFDLKNHYEFDGKFHADLLKMFRKNFSIESNNENMYEVTIKDKDYKKAKKMVDFLLEKADSSFNYFKSTQARLSREYFENRIHLILKDVDSLQNAFIAFQKENDFYEPNAQLEGTLTYLNKFQMLKEEVGVQLHYEKLKRGESSKKYEDLSKQVQTLEASLNKTLKGNQKKLGLVSLNQSPDLVAKYVRFEEEIKIHVLLYKVLRQQSEEFRIEEAKTLKNLHVLEPPWENDKKVSPLRGILLIFTFSMSLLLALVLSSFLELIENEKTKNSALFKEWSQLIGVFLRRAKV